MKHLLLTLSIVATLLTSCSKNEPTGEEKNAFVISTEFTLIQIYEYKGETGFNLLADDELFGRPYRILMHPVPDSLKGKLKEGDRIKGTEIIDIVRYR